MGVAGTPLLTKSKPFEQRTEKEQAFILAFVASGNFLEAYEAANYSIANPRGALANARALFIRLRDNIHEQINSRIGGHVALAMNVYEEILKKGSTASLALQQKCAADILNRAGFDTPQEIILRDEREPGEMSTQDIRANIATLLAKSGLKVVAGGKTD